MVCCTKQEVYSAKTEVNTSVYMNEDKICRICFHNVRLYYVYIEFDVISKRKYRLLFRVVLFTVTFLFTFTLLFNSLCFDACISVNLKYAVEHVVVCYVPQGTFILLRAAVLCVTKDILLYCVIQN
jgi:hypothetical protein